MDKMKSLLNKNKLVLLGLSVFTLLLIIGTSFALYQIVNTQTEENLVDVGCFNVGITKQENAINLENAYPISDEKGKSLTPFTFTLTNNCNVTGKYTVNLEVLKDSTMSTSFIKTLVNNGTISKLDALPKAETKNSGSIEARTIASGILTPNSSADYSVSLWMDENVTIEDGAMNKILKSKIVVISKALSQITSDDPITQSIIAQLDTTGKCPRVNADGTMQLTDAETGSGYLCSAPDNYGLSYYYRGDVTNNYVQFGKWPDDVEDVVYGFAKPTDNEPIPSSYEYSTMEECQSSTNQYKYNCTLVSRKGKPMYWRIVRLNGDGSYRLVYDGTNLYENSQVSVDRQIYNSFSSDNSEDSSNNEEKLVLSLFDNSSAGYMFGDPGGINEGTKVAGKYSYSSSSTLKIAKNYTHTSTKTDSDDSTGFKLSEPIEVKGSDLTNDYVGYYTFFDGDTENAQIIYKIDSIDTSNEEILYKVLGYGTTSKEQAQTNKNDSVYKLYLDYWYTKVLNNTKYEEYLSDTIYCNDRTISSSNFDNETITNLGYGQEPTIYRWGVPIGKNIANVNIFNFNVTPTATSVSAKLLCSVKNDSFTVSDNLYGNANLTYPVGMLTTDEAVLAGAYFGKSNNNYYLYSSNGYFLIDPVIFPFTYGMTSTSLRYPTKTYINGNGSLGFNFSVDTILTPIINLKAGSINTGDGTKDNPYKIVEVDETPKVNVTYYLNNKLSKLEPSAYEKDRYTLQKVECDNGVTGTWNTDKWSLETSTATTNSTCKVYFTYDQKLKAEYYVNGNRSNITPESAKVNGYTFDNVSCNNDAVGTWNAETGELEVSNVVIDTTCKVYFKTPTVKILNNNVLVDSLGKCPNVNSDNSVNVTAKEEKNDYLCKAKDAYGDSYYYRGTVTNNYVKFADKYWRIVRINGDGTVRIIYDGTSAHANGETSEDRQIGTSAFNSNYNDNAYVGYMYGTTGASTYAATHANTNDSTIKTYIDNWYKTNILGTNNEQYLADNIFCNDRSLSGENTGTGAGTSSTKYRWYRYPWESEKYSIYNNKMFMKCLQQSDAFTVSDTANGNGALTYPIGLLSADELILAGGWSYNNTDYYLYTGQYWWTSTPYDSGSNTYVNLSTPSFTSDIRYTNNTYGVRPVINLKADALKVGTGTADDPYRIS